MRTEILRGVARLAPLRMLWCTTAIMLATPPMTAFAAVGMQELDTPGQAEVESAQPVEQEHVTAQPPPDWVTAHGPYTHWYPDTTQLVRNRDAAGDQKAWKDVIGTREFDTKGVAVRWEGKVLHLAILTNFPDRNVMAAGRTVAPADLALDLDGNGTLETGVVLSGVRSAGDRGVVRADNIRKATAYKVKKWLRPDDILAHTYGQGWRWIGLTGQELAYASVPVWVGEGTPRDDLAVTVDWRVNGRGSDYVVFVTLTRTDGNGELWNLPVIWGTAVCGNDVVFAPIARLGDLIETTSDREKADGESEDGQEASDGHDESSEDTVSNGGMGVGVEGGASEIGEAREGEETISEGVSEGSDEPAPTWNETFPVAFPETTGESTFGGGGSGGGTSTGTSGGGGGGTPAPEGSGGGTSTTSGGGSSGGGSEGGGGAETPVVTEEGGGGTENATQIPEPPLPWLLGTAVAGLTTARTLRHRRRRKLPLALTEG